MKTYTLTPECIEDLLVWYKGESETVFVTTSGVEKVLEAFFTDHPEHLTEAPSTSKRDEVLRVATALAAGMAGNSALTEYLSGNIPTPVPDRIAEIASDMSERIIAEVDKRFNTNNQ